MSWGRPVCDIHGARCSCDEDRGQFGYDDYTDDYGVYADQAEDAMIAGWDEALSR